MRSLRYLLAGLIFSACFAVFGCAPKTDVAGTDAAKLPVLTKAQAIQATNRMYARHGLEQDANASNTGGN